MMSLVYVRPATPADEPAILPIIAGAKAQLKQAGSSQWQSGYPNALTIHHDVKQATAYVLIVDQQVAGYAAVIVGVEPTYAKIVGAWQNNEQPYATIHRMAISTQHRGQHLAKFFLSNLVSIHRTQGVVNYRIDTFKANAVMQHIATSNGFIYRGEIHVVDPIDSARLAYELNL